MRIMYVEDNQANLFLVQRVARMGNHQVIFYTDGESALKNFATDKPDLVLMDVQLSGQLTGLDVVRKLRAEGHKTPIVAVTAYAMVGDRERCIEAGCDGYLSKPLPVTELVEIITRYEVRNALGTNGKPQTGMLRPPDEASAKQEPKAAEPAAPAASPAPVVSADVPVAPTQPAESSQSVRPESGSASA